VGEPELLVEPMVPQLVRNKPGTVVLGLRDSQSGAFTDATITVNGQQFLSRNGHVSVTLTPVDAVQTLDVVIDQPGYQFVRKQIRLPVSTTWAGHPFGVDANQELAAWRRKIMSQLP
ncbi:MAG: putative serine protease, partial [Firmicutes bacterium]|nr:putative serine protease [Bacillota bacterium]